MRAMVVYPCRCLCFGLSQMTYTLPERWTILHFGQRLRTEDDTFIGLSPFPEARAQPNP